MYIQITASNASANPENYVRWFIVRDKKPGSTTLVPSISDVVSNPLGAGPADTQEEANLSLMTFRPLNNIQMGRFQWLASGFVKISNESGAGEKTKIFKKTIYVRQPCYFGAGESDNEIGPGHIYMYAYGTDPLPNDEGAPSIQYAYRMKFTDV